MKLYDLKNRTFLQRDDRIEFVWKAQAQTEDLDVHGFQYSILRYLSYARIDLKLQPRRKKIILTHFLLKDIIGNNHEEIFIVDVGAMPEGAPRYDILIKNYRTRLVGFEPNEEQLEKLHQLDDSSAEYLPYFLGEGKDHQFNFTRYPGSSID